MNEDEEIAGNAPYAPREYAPYAPREYDREWILGLDEKISDRVLRVVSAMSDIPRQGWVSLLLGEFFTACEDAVLAERAVLEERKMASPEAKETRHERLVEVQVNGKVVGRVQLPMGATTMDARLACLMFTEGKIEKKFLFVPREIISITIE